MITTLLAPACLCRQLSFSFRIQIKPMAGMFDGLPLLYPARTNIGITRSMRVVLPLFDRADKKDRIGWRHHCVPFAA